MYERSGDGVVFYQGERRELLKRIAGFSPESEAVEKELVPEVLSRKAERTAERLISRFVAVFNTLVPAPVRAVWTCIKAVRYVAAGMCPSAEAGGAGAGRDGYHRFPPGL